MLTNSLKIWDTPKRDFFEFKFFQSDEKIWQHNCCASFGSVLQHLTFLTVLGCTETGLVRYLGNHVFRSLYLRKYIRYDSHIFFQNAQNLMDISEMEKKIEKIFSVSEIIAFVALNTHFYRERKLVISSQYVNK